MTIRINKNRPPAQRTVFSMMVDSRTIGCYFHYKLETLNFSKSGMLLQIGESFNKVPFAINTILELTVDPQQNVLSEPIKCLAKVVRTENRTVEGKVFVEKFGIQLIPLESDDLISWDKAIGRFEAHDSIQKAS